MKEKPLDKDKDKDKDKGEILMGRPVYFVLDIDRVLIDTERVYRTNRTEIAPYPEDEGALDKLKSLGTLCVFSEVTVNGSREFQELKLERIGINKYVLEDDVHISNDKIAQLSEIFKRYKGGLVFLVDDRIDVLEAAKRIDDQVITVWVQRGMHAEVAMEKPQAFKPDVTVFNLNGLAIMAPGIIAEKTPAPVLK